MDREQNYNIVDTPPKDRTYWPAMEDFEEQETIVKHVQVASNSRSRAQQLRTIGCI